MAESFTVSVWAPAELLACEGKPATVVREAALLPFTVVSPARIGSVVPMGPGAAWFHATVTALFAVGGVASDE